MGECPGNEGDVGLGALELESIGAGCHYKLLVRNMISWCALGRSLHLGVWDELEGENLEAESSLKSNSKGTSLVAQRLRICLPMQGTQV